MLEQINRRFVFDELGVTFLGVLTIGLSALATYPIRQYVMTPEAVYVYVVDHGTGKYGLYVHTTWDGYDTARICVSCPLVRRISQIARAASGTL